MRLVFGQCVFDSAARQLTLDGRPVTLGPKAFDFLRLLLEERPRALSKAELHERLWPETFVADSSLARVASEVRSAIGDDEARIEDLGSKNGTYHRGRRIEAPVELEDGDEVAVGPAVLVFRSADGWESTETALEAPSGE